MAGKRVNVYCTTGNREGRFQQMAEGGWMEAELSGYRWGEPARGCAVDGIGLSVAAGIGAGMEAGVSE